MFKKHKKVIIGVSCLLVIIIVGLILFFTLANRKTEIYANSYDNQVKFSLGSYQVDAFFVSSRTGDSITKTSEVYEIFQDKVIESSCLVSTYNTEYADTTFTNYVLLYDGYYFMAWIDNAEQLVIENLAAQFSAATTEFMFSFPVTDMGFSETGENFVAWDDLLWIYDFSGLADFYSQLADGYCKIDEENQIISLNCCDANNFRDITTDFPITITCTDSGIKLSFDSEKLPDFYNDY